MLVLLSFVMVLVATVLLVLGLLVSGDGITLIYVSIGMSAVAAVLLIIAVRSSKPAYDAAGGPSPLEPEREPERELVGAGVSARAGSGADATTTLPAVPPTDLAPAAADAVPMAPPPVEPEPAAGAAAPSGEWLASDTEWGDEAPGEWDANGEVDFPIADYDDLTVDEVLPLLPQLYSDELDVVEAREREGLNRREVIDALARLRITGTDADREVAPDADADTGTDAGVWEEEAPAPADGSPIPGYDSMPVSEIVAALARLDDRGLDAVRAHEAATKNRRTVLAAIDRRLGATTPAPAPAPAPAPRRTATAAKKKAAAPAKKAAAAAKKKAAAPAKKAAAAAKKKAAAPAKKAAAVAKKKAATKKAAAPAKKAAAKKR